MKSTRTRLAVSVGCPCGVGPEIAVAASVRALAQGIGVLLVGDLEILRRTASLHDVPEQKLVRVESLDTAFERTDVIPVYNPVALLSRAESVFGSPTEAAGRAQLAWIDAATDIVANHLADALVTGPVSKEVIAHCGAPGAAEFAGHTEHIARRLGAPDPVMLFVADNVTTALVTTHLALAKVPEAITAHAVANTTVRLAETLWDLQTRQQSRIVVLALNPHAGENGMFGNEERLAIEPGIALAVEQLKARGIDVVVDGPLGAETAFRKAFDGAYEGVVAMYHDQGTIPMKIRCFGKAVNVTAGLPIIRTSVDHGTAYDIAGKGAAEPGSMLEAMLLAARLHQARLL